MKKKKTFKKTIFICLLSVILALILGGICSYAIEDNEIINILTKNSDLFNQNSIFASVLRYIGWLLTELLALLAKTAADVYDVCFGFIDFTKYTPVQEFITKWQPVFIALVCLSLLTIGILMCIGWEKKPQFVINLFIAIVVITSSTYFINTLNQFISDDIRNGILGTRSSQVVYQMCGNNIHDLRYLDAIVGLENLNDGDNAKKVYDNLTEKQFNNININETIEPGSLSDSGNPIIKKRVVSTIEDNTEKYSLEKVYDGVAWTDMLNEYYYRYKVDFFVLWLELLSILIVYLFMSYKVIRVIYEIVIHEILANVYSANLNNNQKILKILDSLKDSYIILLLTTVIIKVYLLATKFIATWDISGLTKGLILVFIAFAVIDGPNLIQKLTGTDIGGSDGARKFMSLMYGARMVKDVAATPYRVGKKAVEKGKDMYNKGKNAFDSLSDRMSGNDVTPDSSGGNDSQNNLNQQNNNRNEQSANNNINQDNSQMNNENLGDSNISDSNTFPDNNSNIGSDNPLNVSASSGDIPSAPSNETSLSNSPTNSSAISPEQGKNQGGYDMGNIGQVQTKKDALNGVGNTNRSVADSSMKQMEKDVSTPNSVYSQPNTGASLNGKPIGTNSAIFSEPKTDSHFPKIVRDINRKKKEE